MKRKKVERVERKREQKREKKQKERVGKKELLIELKKEESRKQEGIQQKKGKDNEKEKRKMEEEQLVKATTPVKVATIESVIKEDKDIIFFIDFASSILNKSGQIIVRDKQSSSYAVNAVISIKEAMLRMKVKEDSIVNQLNAQIQNVGDLFSKLRNILTESISIIETKIGEWKGVEPSTPVGEPSTGKVRRRRKKVNKESEPQLPSDIDEPPLQEENLREENEDPWA